MNNFDNFWMAVIDFINLNGCGIDTNSKILVPHELLSVFTEAKPYGVSFFNSSENFDWIVLHKGRLEELSNRFINKIIDQHHYVFGNEVFNVYTRLNLEPEKSKKHLLELGTVRERQAGVISRATKEKAEFNQNILLVTANHFGNVGDDAITVSAHDMLEQVYPGAKITVAAPPVTRNQIESNDMLVIGGGGLLYDARIENTINYTNYIFYAKEAQKKVIAIGIGTQGIKTELGINLYKEALDSCEYIIVRDKKDADVLTQTVKTQSPIHITQDLVFALSKSQPPAVLAGQQGKKKRVIVALLDSSNLLASRFMRNYQAAVEVSVRMLSEKYDVLYVAQSHDDLEMYRSFKKKYGGQIIKFNYDEVKDVENLYSSVDLVVTSRFHGLIFSIKAAVPVIAVGSNGSKIERLIKHYTPSLEESLIQLRDFSTENFINKLNLFENNFGKMLMVSSTDRENCINTSFSTINIMREYKEKYSESNVL